MKVLNVSVLLLTAVTLVGCNSNSYNGGNGGNGGGGPQDTSYTGTFVDASGTNGTLSFTLPYVSPVVLGTYSVLGSSGVLITGQLHIGGSTIDLAGTFDGPSGDLSLSGGGYSFAGTRAPDGSYSGTLTAPGGSGSWVALSASGATATVYCGTYICELALCDPLQQTESFNLVVSGTTAIAAVVLLNGDFGVAAGTVSGADIEFDVGTIHLGGQISGNSVGGDWSDQASFEGGSWSGTTTACSASD